MLLAVLMAALVAGCDSTGPSKPGVDGYWKGQMIGTVLNEDGPMPTSRTNEAPRRVLLKLEESAGIVQGTFAESSDVITFKQIGNEGSRRISTYAVTGTLEGKRVRLSFATEPGRTFKVDALVNNGVITGTYVAQYSTEFSRETGSGQIEIERF